MLGWATEHQLSRQKVEQLQDWGDLVKDFSSSSTVLTLERKHKAARGKREDYTQKGEGDKICAKRFVIISAI